MQANAEYAAAIHCEMPRHIADVELYLRDEFPADPGRPSAGRGFDPRRWTLSGGFCFQQGIRKAVCERLL